jgi:RNA polymerase sigma factor (sigma-70 family)
MPIRLERAEEIARFYERHAKRLQRAISAKTVGLDDGGIEDACSFAWEQLIQRRDIDLDHHGGYWWVYRVALRRAWLLACRREREQPRGGLNDRIERATIRETLGELHPRERRELLLYAHGLSYEEIAEVTGTTYTAVNRWLARGKKKLREARDHGRITPDDPRWQPNRPADRR